MTMGEDSSETLEGDGKAVPGKRKWGKTEVVAASVVDVDLKQSSLSGGTPQ